MKAEITEVVRNNTVIGVHGGREVLIINEASLGHLISDLAKLFGKLNEPPKNEQTEEIIDLVIAHMNERWGTTYRKNTEATRKFIRARVNDGATKDEIFLVIDEMWQAWGNDLNMSKYLRPVTIFQPSKFEGYLNQSLRKRGLRDNMIYVADPYGNKKRVTRTQFENAEDGYFKRLD